MRVLVKNNIAEAGLNILKEEDYSLVKRDPADKDSVQAIVCRGAKISTRDYPGLLAVGRAGQGTDKITIDEATKSGVVVLNAPGANANAVAEEFFGALIMDLRNLLPAVLDLKECGAAADTQAEFKEKYEQNKKKHQGSELRGKKIGIIGLGNIGISVANTAVALGMKVLGFEPFPQPEKMHALSREVRCCKTMNEVVRGCDFLTVHVPFNEATDKLLGCKTLGGFQGSHILNFSREEVVDTNHIIKLLDDDRLQRYITDFPTLKLLSRASQVFCLPHLGASTEEAETNCAVMVAEQLVDFLKYGIIRNSVNFPECGDRPKGGIHQRLIIITEDRSGMLVRSRSPLEEVNINIRSSSNESNGQVGYNIVDVDPETPVDASIVNQIEAVEGVIRARLLEF